MSPHLTGGQHTVAMLGAYLGPKQDAMHFEFEEEGE